MFAGEANVSRACIGHSLSGVSCDYVYGGRAMDMLTPAGMGCFSWIGCWTSLRIGWSKNSYKVPHLSKEGKKCPCMYLQLRPHQNLEKYPYIYNIKIHDIFQKLSFKIISFKGWQIHWSLLIVRYMHVFVFIPVVFLISTVPCLAILCRPHLRLAVLTVLRLEPNSLGILAPGVQLYGVLGCFSFPRGHLYVLLETVHRVLLAVATF